MHNEVVIALQKDNEVIIVTDMAVQISTEEALYFKIITVQQITSFLNYRILGELKSMFNSSGIIVILLLRAEISP